MKKYFVSGWTISETMCLDVYLERKHLLLLDGHASHISYNVVNKAATYGIDIWLLPSHTTHRMQPLDVSIFKSFKCNFISIKERFINANATWANESFDKTYLVELASNALKEAHTVSNIQTGFRKTRIYPMNVHAMNDECGPCFLTWIFSLVDNYFKKKKIGI